MLLTAPLLHNGNCFLPAWSVLDVSESGYIRAVHESFEDARIIKYQGILCPGFVNVHCHLELSHLKDRIPERSGLPGFLQRVPTMRDSFSDEEKKTARHAAYAELEKNGIVAVGDIVNTTDTSDLRLLGRLHMHTFVEALGFTETQHFARYAKAVHIVEHFENLAVVEGVILRQSLVPHAPYSVSRALFNLIDKWRPDSLLAIHNQESPAEDVLFKTGRSAFNELYDALGIDISFFQPTMKSSLESYVEWLSASHRCIFVHNTFSTPEDIAFGMSRFRETFWCLCPNANLYIEGQLPEMRNFLESGAVVCLGTDSLASNHQLSIWEEIKTLRHHFPSVSLEMLLQWATGNGAKALAMDQLIGFLEPGKVPGIVELPVDGQGSVRRII